MIGRLILGVVSAGLAMEFEHVMNIGSEGSGEGQFKYVEYFALDSKGNLLATDAAMPMCKCSISRPGSSSPGSEARAMRTITWKSRKASRRPRMEGSS
jgi:hypothetical protein